MPHRAASTIGPVRRQATVTLRGLLGAAHPGPTVAVTVLAGLIAIAAELSLWRGALVILVVLLGQLSIGWSNDWLDATRDAQVGRRDKPVAAGAVSAELVATAARVAVVAAVVSSLALGWRAAVAHTVLVACGWAYNLALKSSVWSWGPYALAFGVLPAVVTLSRTDAASPAAWAVAAGALLGVGAHLTNVLPDLEDDRATGVRGLPHRLGRRLTGMLAAGVLFAASAAIALGPTGSPTAAALVGLGVAAVLAAVAAAAAARAGSRLPFTAAVLIALVDVALLVASGSAVIA
jgi:4-hydroxybenzoate polyprenyltransferase